MELLKFGIFSLNIASFRRYREMCNISFVIYLIMKGLNGFQRPRISDAFLADTVDTARL